MPRGASPKREREYEELKKEFKEEGRYKGREEEVASRIIKNNTLGQIKWEQLVMLGNPEFGCELQPIDFAAYAEACGGTGFTIEDPCDCADILEQAMEVPGPVIVECVVDPFEPPLPAKIEAKQALKFAESLARGTPRRMKIATTILEDRVKELV